MDPVEKSDAIPSLADDTIPITSPHKTDRIRNACQNCRIDALVGLAISRGGLLTDDLRQLACKLLFLSSEHTHNDQI
jgi:hypothetical protein